MPRLLTAAVLVAVALATPASSQQGYVVAGAGSSSIRGDRLAEVDESVSLHLGGIVGKRWGAIGLRAGAVLETGGAIETRRFSRTPGTAGLRMVTVPLEVHYVNRSDGAPTVYIGGGPVLRVGAAAQEPGFDPESVSLSVAGVVGAELGRAFLEGRYTRDVTGYAYDGFNYRGDRGLPFEVDAVALRVGVRLTSR